MAVLSMNKQEFSRLEVRLPAEVRTLVGPIARFPVLAGSAFRPAVSASAHSNHRRLSENCGADGRATAPSGTCGALNDAPSIYFADATLANAFVVRWCVGARAEATGGVFQVREDAEGRGGPAQYP